MADLIQKLCEKYAIPEKIWFYYGGSDYFRDIEINYINPALSLKEKRIIFFGDIEMETNNIRINSVLSLKEKRITLLHEIFHKHPKFNDYSERSSRGLIKVKGVIEKKITKYAKIILSYRKDIVDYLDNVLEEASKLDKERPF